MRLGLALGAVAALVPGVTGAGPDTPGQRDQMCLAPPPVTAVTTPARAILTGYGTGGFDVRTSVPAAQAFFDNGMQLGHAFAHKASVAAFQEAERLDPTCAMCVWGEAWARGPTINYPIDPKEAAVLAALADKAALLGKDGPVKEQRLIAALQKRYRRGGGEGPGDYAFAADLDRLARENPTDNELAILAADAWLIPAAQRDSRTNVPRALELLSAALARKPDDTGAIHFYIHATEMDGIGGQAERYAETLQRLAPAASHLVHMPAHTYYIVGRYEDAVRANMDATALDVANARRQGLADAWALTYHAHNVQFATGAALMSGDAEAALAQSDTALAHAASGKFQFWWQQLSVGTAYFAQGRYATPEHVLALPDPGAQWPYLRAMWRYARGEAYARVGDGAGVRREAALVQVGPTDLTAFGSSTPQGHGMIETAQLVLEGRAAMIEGKPQEASQAYSKAARIQETRLARMSDPPGWWYPIRRSLAASLLEAGQPDRAAAEARTALKAWPNDPVTLAVLAQAERRLGDGKSADLHMAEARRHWHGGARLATLSTPPDA